jgi:hypothetical protein
MKKYMMIGLMTISILLFSCYSSIKIKTPVFQKGMTVKQTLEEIQSSKYSYFIFIQKNSVNIIKSVNLDSLSKNIYSIIIGSLHNDVYYWAFEYDKLFFWGTHLEFARHESPIINEIGIEAAKLINAEMNKK